MIRWTQSARHLFIDELKALVSCINEEELQALILDPSMVDIHAARTTGDMMGCLYSLSRTSVTLCMLVVVPCLPVYSLSFVLCYMVSCMYIWTV